jgi:hypothetical protein
VERNHSARGAAQVPDRESDEIRKLTSDGVGKVENASGSGKRAALTPLVFRPDSDMYGAIVGRKSFRRKLGKFFSSQRVTQCSRGVFPDGPTIGRDADFDASSEDDRAHYWPSQHIELQTRLDLCGHPYPARFAENVGKLVHHS